MKFAENEKSIITIPKYQKCFVYFLLRKGEVVYVGQTQNGIARPFSHTDKDYDEIKILYCVAKELDITEDKFIQKYKPIYNKQSNYAVRWGLLRVRNSVRGLTGISNYTVPRLKKVLKKLNITPVKDYFNGKETISFDEYCVVVDYIKSAVNNYEIHNTRI